MLYTGAFASPDKKQVKIRIQAQTGNLDETTVYFDYGVVPDFKAQEDMQKSLNHLLGVPVIYSLSKDNQKLMNNGFSVLNKSEVVPLGVMVDSDGVYNISSNFIDKFDATSVIRLEDRANSVFTDLRTNIYQANILASEPAEGRFFLHVSYPVEFVPAPSGCDNNDGTILVETENTIQWTLCDLYDANNVQRGTYTNVNGTFDFTGLEEGDYYMVFVFNNYTTTKQFHINTHAISAEIDIAKVNAYTGEELNFHSITKNATHFEWDFGDGTQIIGIANPSLTYYTPGIYNVTLKCSNDYGCQKIANLAMDIDQVSGVSNVDEKFATVSSAGKTLTVNMNDELTRNANIKVYNLLGQSVYNQPVTSKISKVELNNEQAGYYLVSVSNGERSTTKRVYIGM
jgi:hypothetical protein